MAVAAGGAAAAAGGAAAAAAAELSCSCMHKLAYIVALLD